MRPRRLPATLEPPTRQPLSAPLANSVLVGVLISLADKIPVDRGVLEADLLPVVTLFGNRYALSGSPWQHGYLYAVKRGRAGGTPALIVDRDQLWKYPVTLHPKPLGSFVESVSFAISKTTDVSAE